MRLINVDTLQLEDIPSGAIPRYGILWHTWGQDEILFEDMDPMKRGLILEKAGYAKIVATCTKMRERQPKLDYVWVDTCCTNKSSSAELSEAINSMSV